MLLEQHSFALMSNCKIRANDLYIQLNVYELYMSLMQFNQKLFKTDKASDQSLKIELTHFVDGLKPNEPIMEGYMVTIKLKITQNKPDTTTDNYHHWIMLIN